MDDSLIFENYTGDNEKMLIAGVEISVYPDLIVKSKVRKKDYIGALKINIGKGGKADVKALSEYIAVMLHKYVSEFIETDNLVARETNCISYDVFADTLIECPRSVKKRFMDIEAGCKNITAIWNTI